MCLHATTKSVENVQHCKYMSIQQQPPTVSVIQPQKHVINRTISLNSCNWQLVLPTEPAFDAVKIANFTMTQNRAFHLQDSGIRMRMAGCCTLEAEESWSQKKW